MTRIICVSYHLYLQVLGIFLALGQIFLVILDVSNATALTEADKMLDMRLFYKLYYWVVFIANFVVFPFLILFYETDETVRVVSTFPNLLENSNLQFSVEEHSLFVNSCGCIIRLLLFLEE